MQVWIVCKQQLQRGNGHEWQFSSPEWRQQASYFDCEFSPLSSLKYVSIFHSILTCVRVYTSNMTVQLYSTGCTAGVKLTGDSGRVETVLLYCAVLVYTCVLSSVYTALCWHITLQLCQQESQLDWDKLYCVCVLGCVWDGHVDTKGKQFVALQLWVWVCVNGYVSGAPIFGGIFQILGFAQGYIPKTSILGAPEVALKFVVGGVGWLTKPNLMKRFIPRF